MTTDNCTGDDGSCPPILRGVRAALGEPLLSRILSSKILLVGSGGIGCELLKNLALSGFRNVEVIDLDTIDVSNLNRQFLFRSQHVGMPKCVVASEAAMRMVPPLTVAAGDGDGDGTGEATVQRTSARYTPHHGNVCDNAKFNVPYVKTFALVLNALDNVAARRRVNRLCLAASVPLVEAGTAGYLGQVTVIDKASGTECYECQPKPTQKVYPICTIRSTPSQPVHCIVWAKELYKLCFGGKVEDSMLFEDEESLRADMEAAEKEKEEATAAADDEKGGGTVAGDNGEGTAASTGAGGEKSTYMDTVNELRTLLGIESAVSKDNKPQCNDEGALRAKAEQALTALFVTEIEKQIGMDRYKTAEKVPVAISLDDIAKCTDATAIPPTARDGNNGNKRIWSPSECVSELASCFVEVAAQTASPDGSQPLPEFDKDDDMAMRFVTAASNLRSCVFSIEPLQSLYDAKGIAGNIIPAIATTNAIVAGLQVLQSFHILKAQMEGAAADDGEGGEEGGGGLKEVCRYIYCLRDKTRKGYLLQPTTLPCPNPNCFVCRNATISLSLNTDEWTLDMLLNRIIKKELGFSEPTIMVGGDSIVYEEGDDIDPSEYGANLCKKLRDLPGGGVKHGGSMQIEDFSQNLEVEVTVSHRDRWMIEDKDENGKKVGEPREDDREEIEKFEIGGKKPTATAEAAPAARDDAGAKNGSVEAQQPETKDDGSDDDDIEMFVMNDAPKDDSVEEATKESTGRSKPQKKRTVEEEQSTENGNSAKRAKLDDGVIEIE